MSGVTIEDGPPALLPARMLNEFVYCPRLFYLEWVDCRWADNDDTVQGRYTHRAVDAAAGRLPDPEAEQMVGRTTSVRLSDEDLGTAAGFVDTGGVGWSGR